jgi:hypothetical protein
MVVLLLIQKCRRNYLGVEGELEMATSGSFENTLMVNQAVLTGAISWCWIFLLASCRRMSFGR